jgi:excisionase family DNA binding protein
MERVLPDPPRRPLATDRLWSVHDVAYYLDVPVQTIYSWRSAGTGPPGRRVGKRLRFRPADVRDWVESLTTEVA